MIKFSDVIKANARYWYVLIVCILLCFAILFGVAASKNTYTATATFIIDKDPETTTADDPMPSVNGQIEVMDKLIKSGDFAGKVIQDVWRKDKDLASKLDPKILSEGIVVNQYKGTTFFDVKYEYTDKQEITTIINSIQKTVFEAYKEKYPASLDKTILKEMYSIQIVENPNKKAVYSIIGVLIGIVLAEIIITCIIAFNPYAEDKDLLERQTELKVLANISKVRRDK